MDLCLLKNQALPDYDIHLRRVRFFLYACPFLPPLIPDCYPMKFSNIINITQITSPRTAAAYIR